jgi:thioredoxin family protein
VVGGLIVLVVVLAAASAAGFAMRRRQGRFHPPRAKGRGGPWAEERRLRNEASREPKGAPLSWTEERWSEVRATERRGKDRGPERPEASGASRVSGENSVLSAADLGAPLGAQATLVQFSTEVCAYCGPTRELLTQVARERDGVAFVEIDAAARMDLTRRLHVLSTPTVLVLDAVGTIASRASGPPRKAELLTAVGAVLGADGAS